MFEMKNKLSKHIYILPSLLLYAVFVFYPLILTFIQSFFASNPQGEMVKFVGLMNYKALFKNPAYIQSIKNTLLYILLVVPPTVIISVLLAVLVFEKRNNSRLFSVVFTSTMGISATSASLFWRIIFHPTAGVINKIITFFGGEPVGWLTDTNLAMISVSLVTVWMNLGSSFIILLGGIRSIDKSYYEAADVVGAGFWYRTRKITIPLLSPSIFFVTTTTIISTFQSFGLIDMLTSGGPINSTNTMIYHLYKNGFVNFQYGYATAEGVVLLVIIFIISKLQAKISERWVTYQ